MNKEIFYGKIENGEIKIPRRKALKEAMLLFGDKGFQITIEPKKKKRSLSQNAYYRGAVIPCVIDALVDNGYPRSELSNEIVHELLKGKFLKKDVPSEHGDFITITRSTSDLTTSEFLIYIDDIMRWSSTFLNYVIPEPNSQAMMNFE